MFICFFSLLCCPLYFQSSAQIWQWEGFLVFGNFSLFKTPFPWWNSLPPSFVSYIFSYLLSKTWVASGCLMSSAGIQKLFCGIYSAFKCFFDEFVGEKVFSLSYSSTILAPPPGFFFFLSVFFILKIQLYFQVFTQIHWTFLLSSWVIIAICLEFYFNYCNF